MNKLAIQKETINKFSIVIPVYNEAESVGNVVSEIKKTLEPKFSGNYEIIIINDCSTDNCQETLDQIHNSPFPEQVLHHSKNMGYGASLKTGIKNSKHDWILIIDADGTYPVHQIPFLVNQTNEHDLVIGSRDKKDKAIPAERRLAKRFLNRFASYLAGQKIPDINSGLRIFKKDIVLKHWNLFPNGFSFTSTLTMICLTRNHKTIWLPIEYYKRKSKSTLKAGDFKNFLKLVVKMALFFNPLKVFAPISFLIFFIAVFIAAGYFLNFFPVLLDTTIIILCATALQTLFFGLLAEIVIYNK